jgi:hypothetical protein
LEQEKKKMKTPTTSRTRKPIALVILSFSLPVFLFACASGTILKWNQLDAVSLMGSDPGKQKLNTIRFETYGPDAEQLFGYFLYKEGIEVITGGGIPLANLGKVTLLDVMDDYAKAVKARQYSSGSNLIIRETLRDGLVVGYTASDINMDVNIWDITTDNDAKVVLRLVYKDMRKKDGGDMRQDMNDPGL